MEIKNIINKFVETLPQTIGVFGYGSGVKEQVNQKKEELRQIDLILVVKDLKQWNKENMLLHPDYYSVTSHLFFKLPENFQHIGTDICYIPYINFQNSIFKIGMIEEKDFLKDLTEWNTFYLAGRFQKDILTVKSTKEMDDAIAKNRKNALILSLILLGENEFTVKDLFTQIVSLSYLGDTRMKFAENPHKIENIVNGSFEAFQKMYCDEDFFEVHKDNSIEIDYTAIYDYALNDLPSNIQKILNYVEVAEISVLSKEDLLKLRKLLLEYFKARNKKASTLQTIKGIFTSGPTKSIAYGLEKLKKHYRN